MQDIKKIVADSNKFKTIVQQKNLKINIDELLELNTRRTDLITKVDELRQQRNQNVEEIKKVGGKPSQELIDKGKEIKEQLTVLEPELKEVEDKYNYIMWFTPQEFSADTPIGPDESGNVEVKKWQPQDSKLITHNSTPWLRDHIELGEKLDILDLEKGVKTSGFRGYYLKNEAALMHMGLMMYGMKLMQKHGFTNVIPPTLVKDEALYGSGHFPFDQESVFTVDTIGHEKNEEANTSDKKYLIGTAEPSILNYFRDETIKQENLPIKYAGFSQCYRGEIGSYGRDTKGIYRIHEFMKIEQVVITDGNYEESEKWHQQMLGFAEELLQSLELPYRVIQLCTGDMGAGKYKMFDIETWMPSRNAYGETHSASNLGDWQTRRLNIKVEGKDGTKYYAHALNNTVVASPRILIALWENYQNEDGSITVPEVLREYVGVDVIK